MNQPVTQPKSYSTERLSRKEKEDNKFLWYREKIDMYDTKANFLSIGYGGVNEYKRMRVNYDLFNNIVDLSDFAYVATPYGADQGEMPAQMANRDICSYRVKALIGMEMKRPFGYRVMATNKEASNRKVEEETNKIRDFVVNSIMAPIQQQKEAEYQAQLKGRQLTEQEMQEMQAKMQAEIEQMTPDKVRAYMKRDHRDPAEVQGQQLLNYLIKKLDARKKFNNGWKHGLISAYEVYWLGIVNGEPAMKVVNPVRFSCDKASDLDYIEQGEWAAAEYRMHPSQIVQTFDLDDHEIDTLWRNYNHHITQRVHDNLFNFDEYLTYEDKNSIRVLHCVFKGLRKIGWLDYLDEDGVLQTKFMVDEGYKLNRDMGDISISWEWLPEVYEGYKIGMHIYKEMRPVPGQFKDPDNIYKCHLPYYGAIYDNVNSQPTSVMDRMKVYQYYYNIVMYRLELLLASDKGKKILMNINAIPTDSGIDLKKWQYFFESTPFMWYNPDEEGMNQSDVNTIAKTLDLSLASDIQKYIQLADYLEQKCGKAVGITDPVLGQTSVSERVGNNQQNLVQTSHMLEPYFDLHNCIKRNVLQGLLDIAKVAYATSDKKQISYILDDMSSEMLQMDINLLDESTLGLFMEDSSMSEEIKQTIQQLAHAAMQNQKIELSDVLKVIKQDSIQEAEEALLVSEELRESRLQAQAQAQEKAKADIAAKQQEHEKESWQHEADMIILKAEEERKTKIQVQAMLSMGFDPNKDQDNDGVPDVLEVAKHGVDAEIKRATLAKENRALDFQIADAKEKNKLKSKELAQKGASSK
jgi:hypothetical protein